MALYDSEIAFVNRKIPTIKVKWQALPAMSQIASQAYANPDEPKNIIGLLKDAFGKKAIDRFHKMVFTVSSKLQGGVRVVDAVKLLREVLGNDIDSDGGGGGRSYNPLSTQPRPPGRGI